MDLREELMDAMSRASAQQLDLPRKALRNAVRETTLRLAAERIARELVDSRWPAILRSVKRQQPKRKATASKRK
jgi:hypothetical protein